MPRLKAGGRARRGLTADQADELIYGDIFDWTVGVWASDEQRRQAWLANREALIEQSKAERHGEMPAAWHDYDGQGESNA